MGAALSYETYYEQYYKPMNCPDCRKKGGSSYTSIKDDGKRHCASCEWTMRAVKSKRNQNNIQDLFRSEQESDLHENGHSYSGGIGMLDGRIRWESRTFKTEDEAYEYLSDKHQKWGPPMGLRFEKSKSRTSNRQVKKPGWIVGGWCSE